MASHFKELWADLQKPSPVITAIFLFLISFNIFVENLDSPPQPIFDEATYISAARQFSMQGINENWSHPPLGKVLINLGIQIYGNNAIGWRIVGCFFGSITIVIVYFLGLLLFKDPLIALESALIAFFNGALFVQSRIAGLDIYMLTFLMGGIYLSARIWLNEEKASISHLKYTVGAFVCFGLSIACKWYGIVPALFCGGLIFLKIKSKLGFFRALKNLNLIFLTAALAYFGSFYVSQSLRKSTLSVVKVQPSISTPVNRMEPGKTEYGVIDLLRLQFQMFTAQLKFTQAPSEFASSFWSWPLMLYPIWMAVERSFPEEKDRWVRAWVWFGNPVIFWFGFLSIWVCLFRFYQWRDPVAGYLCGLYFVLWISWAFIPRQITFFYYYLPAAMILSFSIPVAFKTIKIRERGRWVFILLAAFTAYYFHPFTVGSPISHEKFRQMIWLPTWKSAPKTITSHLPFY